MLIGSSVCIIRITWMRTETDRAERSKNNIQALDLLVILLPDTGPWKTSCCWCRKLMNKDKTSKLDGNKNREMFNLNEQTKTAATTKKEEEFGGNNNTHAHHTTQARSYKTLPVWTGKGHGGLQGQGDRCEGIHLVKVGTILISDKPQMVTTTTTTSTNWWWWWWERRANKDPTIRWIGQQSTQYFIDFER